MSAAPRIGPYCASSRRSRFTTTFAARAPRGETFDWSAGSDNTSGLDVLQRIANAGMGYFLSSDGLASAGREGIKNWSGVISPQEQTEELQTAFKALSQDDYDGVDVTYVNATTWAEETVQCRFSDNPTPKKVEDYTLDGVKDPDRAYRIDMRRLMKIQHGWGNSLFFTQKSNLLTKIIPHFLSY